MVKKYAPPVAQNDRFAKDLLGNFPGPRQAPTLPLARPGAETPPRPWDAHQGATTLLSSAFADGTGISLLPIHTDQERTTRRVTEAAEGSPSLKHQTPPCFAPTSATSAPLRFVLQPDITAKRYIGIPRCARTRSLHLVLFLGATGPSASESRKYDETYHPPTPRRGGSSVRSLPPRPVFRVCLAWVRILHSSPIRHAEPSQIRGPGAEFFSIRCWTFDVRCSPSAPCPPCSPPTKSA